jgi:hypothetical protein
MKSKPKPTFNLKAFLSKVGNARALDTSCNRARDYPARGVETPCAKRTATMPCGERTA